MKGWACCVLNRHQQKRTFGGWRTSSRDLAYFRVSSDILCSSRKRSSPCVPTTAVVLEQPSQSILHFKGGIDVSSAIPPSIRRSGELPSLLANSEVVSPDSAKSTEFDTWYHMTAYHRVLYISLYSNMCVVCVCFLPIHSGDQVRWTYQPGSHRRKVTQDFSSTFFLRCMP